MKIYLILRIRRVHFDDFPLAAKLKVPSLISGLAQPFEVGDKPGRCKSHPVCAWLLEESDLKMKTLMAYINRPCDQL